MPALAQCFHRSCFYYIRAGSRQPGLSEGITPGGRRPGSVTDITAARRTVQYDDRVQRAWPGSARMHALQNTGFAFVSNEPLVKISDLNFTYDRRPVLSGINMTIPRGKVVAIMGQSGCGKTTTLRLIGGQLKPTQGEVRVAGRAMHELDSAEL